MNEDKITEKRARIRERAQNKKNGKKPSAGIRVISAILILILVAGIYRMVTSGEQPSDFDYSLMKETGDINAEKPVLMGEAAELYSLNLEEPLYQKNADKRIDPYSITKILTCYLAIEKLDPDKIVKVSEYAATPLEDGTSIFLKKGEKISVRDLLYGAMLESGNDAATALAEEVSGSEKEFAELMNQQAKEWGCENTHFVNANGWKDEDHYTTAHDMAIITAKSFENAELRKISLEKEYVIGATNKSGERHLENHTRRGTKKLKDLTCGKTGGWTSKDCSIAVGFSRNYIDGVVVVLRTTVKRRRDDARRLIEYSQIATPGFIVANAGDIVCETDVKGSAEPTADLYIDDTLYAYPKGHEKSGVEVKIQRDELEAPVPKDTKAGTYTLYADGKEIRSGELFTAEDVEKGWFLSRFGISNKTTVRLFEFTAIWLILFIVVRKLCKALGL